MVTDHRLPALKRLGGAGPAKRYNGAAMLSQLAFLGQEILEQMAGLGRFTRFCLRTVWWTFRAPGRWARGSLLMPQLFQMGTRSIPVIMLLGAFVGMVLAVELYEPFAQWGQQVNVGGIIILAVVTHIGPVLAAVMLAGRVGGSISAELGTMHVTEQLDAMRVMGADPIAYLVVPRVFACILMIPLLTIFSDLLGVVGGYVVTVRFYGVSSGAFWEFARKFIEPYDLFSGLAKSVVFGAAIGLISCYKGFHCRQGAAGVGRAATDAFVASFVAIIISNFFLAIFLQDLYEFFFGFSAGRG